jgi:hypothetical protein
MKISEIILEKHNELLRDIILQRNPDYQLREEDVRNMIEKAVECKYEELMHYNQELALVKLLIETTLSYGRSKFLEGVESARQSIVSDNPIPPQFTP